MNFELKYNWSLEEIKELYNRPLLDLIHRAGVVQRHYHTSSEVQVCCIINIKTGGCPEDCKYCSQSSRYKTFVEATPLMDLEDVLEMADEAIAQGATRICLGAAWRQVRDNKPFDLILEMIKALSQRGVEVCCCLGMLQEHQAKKLADAGLYAYNHNIDTSKEHYNSIISTRSFDDRIRTLDIIEKTDITVCSGVILGVGETMNDRISFLHTLSTRNPHPESVPINRLAAIKGTPLGDQPEVSIWEMLRVIAVARLLMPQSMIRLSAGRMSMSLEQQALCFLAGANSIHFGAKLLTCDNPSFEADNEMFKLFGLTKRPAYARENCSC